MFKLESYNYRVFKDHTHTHTVDSGKSYVVYGLEH